MELMTIQLSRWRLAASHQVELIDTTVKSGEAFLAPTWDIVMGYKQGQIDEAQYTAMYTKLMRASYAAHRDLWMKLINIQHPVAVACYCPHRVNGEVKFCHRLLLPAFLEKVCAHHGVDFKFYGELF